MSDLPGYPSRRGFLKGSAAGVALIGVASTAQAQAQAQEMPPITLDDYQPTYFTPDEWLFILAATDRLIPSGGDGKPGALDTHVPIFIDLQLADDYGRADDWYMVGPHDPSVGADRGWQTPLSPALLYRQAIPVVNTHCERTYGAAFSALTPEQMDEVLAGLQSGDIVMPAEMKIFFTTLLANTKEGYFSDPMYGGNRGMQSWVYIGFPGARAAYREWPTRHNIEYPLGPVSIKGERA